MEGTIHKFNVLDLAILALGRVKHASGHKLGSPGLGLLFLEFGDQLRVSIGLLLLVNIGNDADLLKSFPAEFDSVSFFAFWLFVGELNAERKVDLLVILYGDR